MAASYWLCGRKEVVMQRLIRKWQRKSLYKKSLILFTILLFILAGILLTYVYNSMVLYERNLVDNYIKYLATSSKITDNIKDNLFEVSKYEKSNAKITDGLKKVFKDDNLKIKKNSKLSNSDIYAYDLYNDDLLISTVSLKSVNSYKRMAILTIEEWNVEDIKTYFDKGIYSYEINIPSNYKVTINGKTLEDDALTSEGDVAGLERLTEYTEIEKSKTYNVNNLVYKPEIKIYDENNQEVKYEVKNGQIKVAKEFKKFKTLEEAQSYIKDNFDIMAFAKNYSLFLTDDLEGSYHGFSTLLPYLIKDSYMYQMAYNWSHNVDITFVSSHRLKNPVFTNERVENFIIYNDNAFSSEVYLEKNMVVSGKDKQDVMHDRLYFIYYEGGYKLVNMEAIK